MSKSQKQRRKRSRSPVRKRVITRSQSQLDALAQEAGPSHAPDTGMMPSGVPPGYPTSEMQTVHNAPYLPQPGPSSFLPYGQPAMPASSPATMSDLTSLSASTYSAAGPSGVNAYPAVQTRAQEKATQSASLPKLKRQLSDEMRKRRADKAQRKRNRDVEDRVNLNNVLPEDRRLPTDPPGLVEVMRRATEYIPEMRSELQTSYQQNEELKRNLEHEIRTNEVIGTILSTEETEDAEGSIKLTASAHILRLQEEIRLLRAERDDHR